MVKQERGVFAKRVGTPALSARVSFGKSVPNCSALFRVVAGATAFGRPGAADRGSERGDIAGIRTKRHSCALPRRPERGRRSRSSGGRSGVSWGESSTGVRRNQGGGEIESVAQPGDGVGLPPPDRGVRLEWADMPRRVRGEIERWLGGVVVDAQLRSLPASHPGWRRA